MSLLVSESLTADAVMSTSIARTTGGQWRSDTGSRVRSSPSSPPPSPASSSPATSIVPTTPGQEGNDDNAALTTGVAVGVVLAVVLVVVVAAIVLAVCSVQWRRRKYDLSCNKIYEVPYDAYIG